MDFRKRLWRKALDLGWNYEDLARKVGISGVYVSKIMQGKVVPSDEVIYRLSEVLDLDLAELVIAAHYEKAPPQVKPVFEEISRAVRDDLISPDVSLDNIETSFLGHGRAIPVVGMVRAGEFAASEDGGFPPDVADQYVYTDRKGKNLFGVRVVNDSMEPDFREGDVLIVNPNLEPQNGDYAIAKLVDENQATFKKLVLHAGIIILRPLNPRYQDIVITDPEKVMLIGKVVERKTLL